MLSVFFSICHDKGHQNEDILVITTIISARKLTIEKHDVSTTSCHHCQMNKLEITERHIYRFESEKK